MAHKANSDHPKVFKSKPRLAFAWTLILLFSFVTQQVFQNTALYFTSLTNILMSDPFDGTTMPIREVPDYSKISYWDAKDLPKDQIDPDNFMPLPIYDPTGMDKPWELLASLTNGVELTQKKTVYTVLYLGDYAMTYLENVAGHPGVDIVVPIGTEIYAISNAVVTRAKETSGAGKHIVLRHDNVPKIDNPEETTTYWSVYEHLSGMVVEPGDLVRKGQLIGWTGNTGNSTAPHLHFQIDNNEAPWHPYWPADFNDPSDAGSKTIHPMNWVYQYEDFEVVGGNTEPEPEQNEEPEENNEPEQNEDPEPEPEPEEEDEPEPVLASEEPNAAALRIMADAQGVVGVPLSLVLDAVNNEGERIADFKPSHEIVLTASIQGEFSRGNLSENDFENGRVRLDFVPEEAGDLEIIAKMSTAGGNLEVRITNQVASTSAFKVEFQAASLETGVPVSVQIVALDNENQPTTSVNFPGSLNLSAQSGQGTFEPNYLNASDFESGLAMVTFTPTSTESVKVKAQAGALVGHTEKVNVNESEQLFPDVSQTHPNFQAINYLKNEGIIQGFGDGSFKPDQKVTRAQLLKIILLANNHNIDESALSTFPDVNRSAWYSAFVKKATDLQIVNGYPDGSFKPDKTVNRAEAFKIILETLKGSELSAPDFSPYPDAPANQWFAKYAAFAKSNNLIDSALFEPVMEMTRADVSEVMFRILK